MREPVSLKPRLHNHHTRDIGWTCKRCDSLVRINHPHISSAVEGTVGGVGFDEEAFDLEVSQEGQGEGDEDDREGDEDDESQSDQAQEDQDRKDLGDGA